MIFSKIRSYSSLGEEVDVAIPWLLALRWGEILCQLFLTVTVVLFMDIEVPLVLVALILVFEGGTNLSLYVRQKQKKRISNQSIVVILLLDTIFLTLLLYLTGGVMNPFVFLYLLHIVLGAIILQELCSWLITVTTLLCYGLLFYFPPPVINDLSGASTLSDLAGCHLIGGITGSFQLHLQGMWVAFVITSVFIVFFVSKIQKALAEHRTTLRILEKEKNRNEKLSSLATLAAGAAHELSTPLCTVAVASGEMIHTLEEQGCQTDLLEDAQLIRKQIADCKEILYQMAAGAGKHLGEEKRRCPVREIVANILDELSEEQRQRVQVDLEPDLGTVFIPLRSLCRTVKGLLLNGLEASDDQSKVTMRVCTGADKLRIVIEDHGAGIPERDRQLVSTAFFTTKDSGLGLGLFLAGNLAEQFRGTLDISSDFGHGTTVTMALSLELLTYKPANLGLT